MTVICHAAKTGKRKGPDGSPCRCETLERYTVACQVSGSAPENVVTDNTALGNFFDLVSFVPVWTANTWFSNVFVTRNAACINWPISDAIASFSDAMTLRC